MFDFKIKYIPGSTNTIPDSLSRRPDYSDETNPKLPSSILPEHCFTNLATLAQNPFDSKICKDVRAFKKYNLFIKQELY